MPMLSMKTKKPMKPMLEILEITDDAGLSSPNHPASAPRFLGLVLVCGKPCEQQDLACELLRPDS